MNATSEVSAPVVPVGIRASSRYLPELESLRGIAILLVYLFHTDGLVHFPQRPLTTLWSVPVRRGNTGVDLFFVVSAFLLTLPFVAEADHGRPVRLRRYFSRRALRILPLYWAAIIPVILLTAQGWSDLLEGLPLFVFIHAGTPPMPRMFPYATVWWSLATECQFYLALPAVRWVLRPRTGVWLGLGLLSAWAIAYGEALTTPALQADEWIWLFASLFGRAPVFVFGMIAAVLYARYGARTRDRLKDIPWVRMGGADGMLLIVGLLVLMLLYRVAPYDYVAERAPLAIWHAAGGALWTAFLGLVLVAPLQSRWLVCNPILAWIGTISYSIYLWHVPIVWESVRLIRRTWPTLLHPWDAGTLAAVGVITAVVFGFSALSYRFIESPFLRYKARLD